MASRYSLFSDREIGTLKWLFAGKIYEVMQNKDISEEKKSEYLQMFQEILDEKKIRKQPFVD